jgi:hypothetical protein
MKEDEREGTCIGVSFALKEDEVLVQILSGKPEVEILRGKLGRMWENCNKILSENVVVRLLLRLIWSCIM